ncbi:MAG: RES family NAD+ phosphorylase, partial [Amaricoccus sp.]|nr:RES family NAD+ phosphorylase [Amaricoccus sp.]
AVRLIASSWHKPPVLSPLVASDDDLDRLARIEGLTSGRLAAERGGLPDLDARELAYSARERALRTWGDVTVNAAFSYARTGGNRFNDERRGAWYCATETLVSIEEVGCHKTRELIAADWLHETATYVELVADFVGAFPDLRGVRPSPPCLGSDPDTAYPLGQALARELRAGGARGLVYPSVRKAGGACLVAFEPQIVQNVRPGARWEMTWSGAPAFAARTV